MRPFLPQVRLLALGLPLLLAGCRSEQSSDTRQPMAATPVPVRLMTTKIVSQSRPLELTGTVRARQRVVITSKLPGTLLTVDARTGDRIQLGQQVASLDDQEPAIEAQRMQAALEAATRGREQAEHGIAAAEADANLAAATVRRIQELFDKRSASQQELDQASARHLSAQAGLAMARGRVEEARANEEAARAASRGAQLRLSYTRVLAPLNGIVVSRNVDPGAVVAPGMPLLEVEEAEAYRLEVTVPESFLSEVLVGTQAAVEVPSLGWRASGRVVEMEPAAQPGSRSTLAKIQLPNQRGLRGGLFGRATVSAGQQSLLIVPEAAIVRQGNLAFVYIHVDGAARLRLIALGRRFDSGMEVLSGLQAGEQIITSDVTRLKDGLPVEMEP